MMRRSVATAVVVMVVAVVGMGGTSIAAAARPVVTAAGTTQCGFGSGKGTVSPPFKLAAGVGSRTTKSTVKLLCTGTTTNGLVTPVSARIVTKSVSPTSSTTCTGLQSVRESPSVTTMDIKWNAIGGKINPTHIVFSTSQTGVPSMGSTTPGPSGTATITGSYAGESAVSQLVVSDTLQSLTDACLKKGIKKLHFGPASTLRITPRAVPAAGRYSTPQYDSSATRQYLGIQYTTAVDYTGATIPLLLDVYAPPATAPSPRPTIVLIHGGAFVGGGRAEMAGVAQQWVTRGYNAVSIEYRLDQTLRQDSSPPKVVAAATNATLDAEAAVRWMKANAASYGIDTTRIAAVGYSAGGAIALGLSAAPDLLPTGPNAAYSSKIAAAVSTGAYLTPAIDLGVLHITSGLAPILMFHYATDVASNTGPYAFRTCTAYRQAGSTCEYVGQPGEGHTTDLTPGSVWWANEIGPFVWHYLRLAG
jgi:dienelactone hydrolase